MSIEDNLKPSIMLISPTDIEGDIKKLEEQLRFHQEQESNNVQKVKEELQKIWETLSWLKIAEVQGVWKSKTCRHSLNGRCNAWNVSEPERIGLSQDMVEIGNDNTRHVIVERFPNFCIACPLYEVKRS
ncbi:hypothetical protein [Metallosphaera hakonensis]|uniref:Uncharacterized protein n=1 Tax=Metallosphaera hakonensis JCM 8857 = DSM 7519 TaxID=1293036 RepID=A0A2U9IU72_9CREN|nr:hypothetical protein [Metallosphaera hakonensis]AWR99620.1 hypothetical protein DFR87_07900 [Metallosphaera hakonensis JCM 8857 = DSM 7519]